MSLPSQVNSLAMISSPRNAGLVGVTDIVAVPS
jgi:hypothetical protein